MPDFSKCPGGDCIVRNQCVRYTAEAGPWQSWMPTPEDAGPDCTYFMPASGRGKPTETEPLFGDNETERETNN